MLTLIQFLFRLSFGLALAMAVTSPRRVTSGYYRNNSYVLLGLNALVLVVVWLKPELLHVTLPMLAVALSWASVVAWLYEKPRAGIVTLALLAVTALVGAWYTLPPAEAGSSALAPLLRLIDPAAGGLVLGTTMAAMLLGHWYLNSPGMQLEPLRRLLVLIALALVLRAGISGAGFVGQVAIVGWPRGITLAFVGLRWATGIVAMAAVAAMSWHALAVPNTQSATGILYVGVIATFLGELTAQLLSAEALFPL